MSSTLCKARAPSPASRQGGDIANLVPYASSAYERRPFAIANLNP